MTKLAILTVSDSRNLETDKSGQLISQLAQNKEIKTIERKIVKDDLVEIQAGFLSLEMLNPDLIVVNGGSGFAQRDFTIAALSPLIPQKIPGFGELFRQISYADIGIKAIASKALAGFNYRNQLVYCIPGSTNACQTAMKEIILPGFEHLLFEKSDLRKEIHHHAN